MSNVYEVGKSELVREVSSRLKSVIKERPSYMDYAKSGACRERQPQDPDFWYVRSASLLSYVYAHGPVGVSRLKTRYGGSKGHTVHRKHHMDAGGSIIQDSLNALEQAGLVKKTKKGREITGKGKSFLDKASGELLRAGKQ